MSSKVKLCCALLLLISSVCFSQDLLTPDSPYGLNDHIVSTSFFHWYTATSGQLSGPWIPLEGRASWTGTTDWWKTQIKQVMLANIDVMYVHLIPQFQAQRMNLFQALSQMRAEGYDVPKVAPFLDPLITWNGDPVYDLSVQSVQDMLVDRYILFFQEYYFFNRDAYADDYIAVIDNRVVLDTWHVLVNFTNISSFTRSDIESRLAAAFGAAHPIFNNGIYMVTTESNDTFAFADEQVGQFQFHEYSHSTPYNGITSIQLKAGYWDQNIRDPGYILPRDGGTHYTSAWAAATPAAAKRIYIESWNEYDEGSGIYAANPTGIYTTPINSSTDDWSLTDDPFEYIKTTYEGIRVFKAAEIAFKDSQIIWHDIPLKMRAGQSQLCEVYVRNTGFELWRSADGFKFGQNDYETDFGSGRYYFDDVQNEVDFYTGIFKGRPVKFDVLIEAPVEAGTYLTHWSMLQEGVVWFGEELALNIEVYARSDFDMDGDTDLSDLSHLASDWLLDPAVGVDSDLNDDSKVDLEDFSVLSGEWSSNTAIPSTMNSEIIGSSHVIPRYYFGSEDCLNEGANALLAMGSKVIKIWYYNGNETPDVMYPYNSNWAAAASLLDGLNNTHYTELFDKPFKTFVMNIASFVNPTNPYYWKDYLDQALVDQEEDEFYEFTKALLQKYAGTGKTFILQHHEGDWHTRGHTDADLDPEDGVHNRMITWLNARQRGVARARDEINAQGVFVYHAAEINIVAKSMLEDRYNMVNAVLPYTNLDLVSYSCYDTCLGPALTGNPEMLRDAVNYIKDMMPDSAAFGNDNVYLGEYGIPENEYTLAQIQTVMTNTVTIGLDEKCPYIIYWQLYCNEFKDPASIPPTNSNDDMRGFWLIRPDGTKSWHYDYLKQMCST